MYIIKNSLLFNKIKKMVEENTNDKVMEKDDNYKIDLDLMDDFEELWDEYVSRLSPKELKARNKKFKKYSIFVFLGIVVFWVIAYFSFLYNQFLLVYVDNVFTAEEKEFVVETKEKLWKVYWYLNMLWMDIGNNYEFDWNAERDETQILKTKLNNYLSDESVPYFYKKDNVNVFLVAYTNKLLSKIKEVDKIKADIWKLWFIPSDVNSIMEDVMLQRSLKSIETIKLYAAMQYFSQMNWFLESFSTKMWIPVKAVETILEKFLRQWEFNVENYLQNCYLNPFENSQCNLISDFINYYQYDYWENMTDSERRKIRNEANIFVSLLEHINEKLNDEYSRLSIVMNDFNPGSNQISFTVEVNTYAKDEQSIKDNYKCLIENPHLFIISNLIYLLKESHFILWKDIEIDSLNPSQKNVKVWNEIRTVSSSRYPFNVPIQKVTEKEIYDRVDLDLYKWYDSNINYCTYSTYEDY